VQKIAIAVVALCAIAGVVTAKPRPPRPDEDQFDPERLGPPRPPRPPAPPSPAPEIAVLGKELAGTWTCNGTWLDREGVARTTTGTITVELVLGDAWIRAAYALTVGGKPQDIADHRTYDAVAKQWTRITVTSASTFAITTSLGDDKGAWTWSSADVRDHERRTKDSLELWRERASDGAWQRVSRLTCSR
jgi:hypothetical protein